MDFDFKEDTQYVPDQSDERLKKTRDAARAYVQTLYALLPYLDLSIPDNASKAHGVINMAEQIQKMQSALENPEPTREERVDAFKRGR